MKFEIDEVTGNIYVSEKIIQEGDLPDKFPYPTEADLEQILEAVKKTKEAIRNKDIQDHEQIEQNQKIVNCIFKLYNVKLRSPEINHLREKHNILLLDDTLKIIQSWLNFIVKESTGKTIEEYHNETIF